MLMDNEDELLVFPIPFHRKTKLGPGASARTPRFLLSFFSLQRRKPSHWNGIASSIGLLRSQDCVHRARYVSETGRLIGWPNESSWVRQASDSMENDQVRFEPQTPIGAPWRAHESYMRPEDDWPRRASWGGKSPTESRGHLRRAGGGGAQVLFRDAHYGSGVRL